MFELHYIRETRAEKVVEEVKKSLDIEPNLAIFFLAGDLNKEGRRVKLNCNSISLPVEAIITPEGVWSKGTLVLATDSEVSIQTYTGTPDEVYQRMKKAKKGNFNLLIYPLFYIKSRLSMLKNIIRLKRTSDLERASMVFEEMVYPMNTMLRPFRDEGKTAVALNIFPLNFGIGVPKISFNGRFLGRKVLSVSFKGEVDCEFADTFPERGKSFEETAEILSNELVNTKRVSIVKKGVAIGKIDGMSVREFLRKQRIVMRESIENDVIRGFLGATPYGIWLISKETHGSSALGLMDYDLKFYPSLFDTDIFYDEALFAGEFIKGGIMRVIEKVHESDFAIVDQNIMLMFEERVVEISRVLKSYGVLSSFPSYTGKLGKEFMSEVERNICINTGMTMAFLNFK